MRSRDGNQDHQERKEFLKFVRVEGIKRYCEIGCRNGDTFFYVMRTIGRDGYGVAVDLPENDSSKTNLAEIITELTESFGQGKVYAYWGDSHLAETIKWVNRHCPFDLILIDGDHTLDGVVRDFLVYQHMTRFVVFHDVSAPDDHMSDGKLNGVGRFWRQLKEQESYINNNYRIIREIITSGSNMGFGILEMLK